LPGAVLHRHPQEGGGLLVGAGVVAVQAHEVVLEDVRLGGERVAQPGQRQVGLGLDVQAGQHELHPIAVAT